MSNADLRKRIIREAVAHAYALNVESQGILAVNNFVERNFDAYTELAASRLSHVKLLSSPAQLHAYDTSVHFRDLLKYRKSEDELLAQLDKLPDDVKVLAKHVMGSVPIPTLRGASQTAIFVLFLFACSSAYAIARSVFEPNLTHPWSLSALFARYFASSAFISLPAANGRVRVAIMGTAPELASISLYEVRRGMQTTRVARLQDSLPDAADPLWTATESGSKRMRVMQRFFNTAFGSANSVKKPCDPVRRVLISLSSPSEASVIALAEAAEENRLRNARLEILRRTPFGRRVSLDVRVENVAHVFNKHTGDALKIDAILPEGGDSPARHVRIGLTAMPKPTAALYEKAGGNWAVVQEPTIKEVAIVWDDLTLHPFQKACASVLPPKGGVKAALVIVTTGGGKSFIISEIVANNVMLDADMKTSSCINGALGFVIVQPTPFLRTQIVEKYMVRAPGLLKKYGNPQSIRKNISTDKISEKHIISVISYTQLGNIFKAGNEHFLNNRIIVFDEAHQLTEKTFEVLKSSAKAEQTQVAKALQDFAAWAQKRTYSQLVALTATPPITEPRKIAHFFDLFLTPRASAQVKAIVSSRENYTLPPAQMSNSCGFAEPHLVPAGSRLTGTALEALKRALTGAAIMMYDTNSNLERFPSIEPTRVAFVPMREGGRALEHGRYVDWHREAPMKALFHAVVSQIDPSKMKTLILLNSPTLARRFADFAKALPSALDVHTITPQRPVAGGARTSARRPAASARAGSSAGAAQPSRRRRRVTGAAMASPAAAPPRARPSSGSAAASRADTSGFDVMHLHPDVYWASLVQYLRPFGTYKVTRALFHLMQLEFEDQFLSNVALSSSLMEKKFNFRTDVEAKTIARIKETELSKFLDNMIAPDRRYSEAFSRYTRYAFTITGIGTSTLPVETLTKGESEQDENVQARIDKTINEPHSDLIAVGDIKNFGTGVDFRGFRHLIMTPADSIERDRQAMGRIARDCSLHTYVPKQLWHVDRTLIVPSILKASADAKNPRLTCEQLALRRVAEERAPFIDVWRILFEVSWGALAFRSKGRPLEMK
tara:strand:- start:38702 stop:41893 length:3192 start_codon:yes stop_codon:yes gene_type:complete